MKKSIGCMLGLCILTLEAQISEVYNLRIAKTIKRVADKRILHPYSLTGTVIKQSRKHYDGSTQNLVAGMGTFEYLQPSWYFRADLAGGRIHSNIKEVSFSRNQMDDLLFTSGYSHAFTERIRLAGSGLLGFPLHKDTSLIHAQLGTGHIGLGIQGDGIFLFQSDSRQSIRPAVRIIHFLRRKVPLFPCSDVFYNFTLGNWTDLFIAYNFRDEKRCIEAGYDLTIGRGADIKPYVSDIINEESFTRNSFYASYQHLFAIDEYSIGATIAFSYGFDAESHPFSSRSVIVVWGELAIAF